VTPGLALAGVAGALVVFAAWDALAAVERSTLAAVGTRLLVPLVRAGREGRPPTAPERRRLALVAAGALALAGWLLGGVLTGAVLAVGGPWAAMAAVRSRRSRYRAALRRQAPMVARALADALAGGHSVRGALAAASGGGVTGAAGLELRAAAARLELGEPTSEVLQRLRHRAGVRAFDTIVAAILVQSNAGGDLARLLRQLAGALEEAMRLEGDARTATAQARFTGLLVSVLPLAAAALAELGSPGYLGSLFRSPLTAWLLGCALAFQLGALGLIARIARVER
jgi:tight adherence protein B